MKIALATSPHRALTGPITLQPMPQPIASCCSGLFVGAQWDGQKRHNNNSATNERSERYC